MRIRTSLLSTALAAALIISVSPTAVQAAQNVAYSPQGDWAVSRVAAKAEGKVPYCTMARRFGENVIMTFARNTKNETSVTFDFQPNTLAKGQSYYVTLAPDAAETRAFEVTPVSDKAMVIRLGQDEAFHQALKQSGVLSVDVAGLRYDFNLPDMGKGYQDLDGCLGSMVEPAAGGDSAPAPESILAAPVTGTGPKAVPVASSVPGQENLSELEALKEENMRLRGALERERREYEDRFMKESADSSQVSETMEKVRLLEQENSNLKYQLADARSMTSAAQKAAVPTPAPVACEAPAIDHAQQAELSALKEENSRLKADIAAQKTAMIEMEMAVKGAKDSDAAKVANDTATIVRLQSRIDDLVAQNSTLQSDLKRAQEQSQMAQDSLGAVTSEGNISLSQLKSVESQLKSVESERDSLRKQIEDISAGKEDGLLKLSSSDWNLEQATRRFNEAEREVRRLGIQLEQARSRCTAEKKEIEYMLFDPEIATQEQISKLMSLEAEVVSAKAEVARKDTEVSEKISGYQQQIASLQDEVAAAKAAAQAGAGADFERDELTRKIAMLESEKASLEQKLAESVQPAAGYVPSRDVVAMRPQVVDVKADPVQQEYERVAGYVSTPEDESSYGKPVSLAPRSAVADDAFVSTKAVVAPVAAAAGIASPSVKTSSTQFVTADALSGILRQAGLSLTGDVAKVDDASGADFVAYSWDASGLFGSAEQKPMARPEQFSSMINQYLDKTKSRCGGDFAASPVPVEEASSIQVASYEIACIGADGAGASASLAFYGQDGLFTVVAHEAGVDTMDLAMEARDRVLASIVTAKTVQ